MLRSVLSGLCFIFASSVSLGVGADVVRLSQPVAVDAHSETFGAVVASDEGVLSLGELVANAQALVGQQVVVETKVAQVCQKKGCFFVAQEGALAIRVAFRDYGFFVPSDTGGKTVTLAGELVEVELSADQAAHFNQDAGSSAGIKSGRAYEIVADGVRIPL